VYATARNPAKLVGLSDGIHQLVLDASKDESVDQGIHRIIKTEGRIDILVNSAGGARIGDSELIGELA
jgi:1-acylglycerone phosphate reductase